MRDSFFFKLTAAFLLAIMSFSGSSLPAYAAEVPAVSAKQLPADLSVIQLPKEIGQIESVFKAPSQQTVILIQDAHAIPAAQRNIQRLIDYFQSHYGINQVALEGVPFLDKFLLNHPPASALLVF